MGIYALESLLINAYPIHVLQDPSNQQEYKV